MSRYNYNKSNLIDMDEDLDEEDAVIATAQRLVEGALAICVLLLILAFMQNKDLQDQLADQKAEFKAQQRETQKYSGLLAECLNGGGILDHMNNTAYFCDKPVEVRL